MGKKLELGNYEPRIQQKGVEEAAIEGMKNGDIYWTVRVGRDDWYDTKSQDNAEIIAALARIEQKLKKRQSNGSIL